MITKEGTGQWRTKAKPKKSNGPPEARNLKSLASVWGEFTLCKEKSGGSKLGTSATEKPSGDGNSSKLGGRKGGANKKEGESATN